MGFATRYMAVLGVLYRRIGIAITGDEADVESAPTITAGSAAPTSTSEPAGSIYLRVSSTIGIYQYVSSAWVLRIGAGADLGSSAKVDSLGGSTLTTGTFALTLADNQADALSVKEASTAYLTFTTTNSAESIAVKKRLTTTDGVASGIALVVGGRAYSATAASTAITGATETSTAFDASVTLPADTLKAGTVVDFTAWGKITAQTGAETHTFAYQVGSVVVGVTGNLDPGTNEYFHVRGQVHIRTAGASGTCVGWVEISQGASGGSGSPLRYFLDSTTIDTTAANVCAVYLDRQAGATDSDSMRLDGHVVTLR